MYAVIYVYFMLTYEIMLNYLPTHFLVFDFVFKWIEQWNDLFRNFIVFLNEFYLD